MKRKVSALAVCILIAATVLLSGCGRNAVPPINSGNAEPASPSPSGTSSRIPMRIVTDDLDRRILIPTQSSRFISTAPSITEMIFAAGGGDQLVGVTTFCDYPEGAKSVAKIGDTMNPNIETILALKPDMIFVSTASQLETFMKTLEANGIAVYVLDPDGLPGIYRNIERLGVIFDNSQAALELSFALQLRVSEVCRITNGCLDRDKDGPAPDAVRVFLQISKEPLFTIGGSSFLNQIIRDAGGLLATDHIETAFPKLSKETAAVLNPEVIILSDSPDNQEPNDAFKNSPAVKNGRVYKINADIISRPGPRLVDALEQMARLLHPQKFEKQ